MAAIPGNHHETRDKMKRVQELLDQEIERINDLKDLLLIAEEKVTQLKGELDEYRARITPTPINSCPAEILSTIFRFSIPEGNSIRCIGHLLLVCKRWYTLVVNDPQMWDTIYISAPAQWDMRSWSYSTRLYMESCIERSRATSLNISLNFTLLQTTRQQLIERFRSGFIHSPYSAQTDGDYGIVEYWLHNQDYSKLEDDTDTSTDCLPNHAIQLIGELIGGEENIVQRLESFTLWFPHDVKLLPAIWEQIAPRSINVSRLHLIGSGWDDFPYIGEDDPLPKLSLPQVEDLRMGALHRWDRFLSFDPSSLHKLSVITSFEKDFCSEIGRFDRLRTLTLLPNMWDQFIEMDKDLPNRVYLPMLQELVLVGHFRNLHAVKFDLPRLKRLVVEWMIFHPSRVFTMPMVQPFEVHWAPVDELCSREDILGVANTVIRGFLLHYATSDCFSVTSFLKDSALKVLKVLSTEGVLPPKWRTLSFHDKSGSIERMQVDDIVCR